MSIVHVDHCIFLLVLKHSRIETIIVVNLCFDLHLKLYQEHYNQRMVCYINAMLCIVTLEFCYGF